MNSHPGLTLQKVFLRGVGIKGRRPQAPGESTQLGGGIVSCQKRPNEYLIPSLYYSMSPYTAWFSINKLYMHIYLYHVAFISIS